MDALEMVMCEILADMELHLNALQRGDSESIQKACTAFKKYDSGISKCSKVLQRLITVRENSKAVVRSLILRKNSMSVFARQRPSHRATARSKPSAKVTDSPRTNQLIVSEKKPDIHSPTRMKADDSSRSTNCQHKANTDSPTSKSQCYSSSQSCDVQSVRIVNVTNDKRYANVSACMVPVVDISESDIDTCQQSPLYRVRETGEYIIRVNNITIRGNIGRIFSKRDAKFGVLPCRRHGCEGKFYNKECKFLHHGDIRNFMDYSWKRSDKTHGLPTGVEHGIDLFNTRSLGGLDTIETDLCNMDLRELELRRCQLMHDLLLLTVITNYVD